MVNINLYAWTVRGIQRIAVIKALSHSMCPAQICKSSKQYAHKISLNNTSDVLREIVRQGLAICLNPLAKTGRIYQLTAVGVEIREELMK